MQLTDETQGAPTPTHIDIDPVLTDRAVFAAMLDPGEPEISDDELDWMMSGCYGTEMVEVDVEVRFGWRTRTVRKRIIRTIPGPIKH